MHLLVNNPLLVHMTQLFTVYTESSAHCKVNFSFKLRRFSGKFLLKFCKNTEQNCCQTTLKLCEPTSQKSLENCWDVDKVEYCILKEESKELHILLYELETKCISH